MSGNPRVAKRVTILVRSHASVPRGADRLATAIVSFLRREGAAGATIFRGIDGVRAGERLRSPSVTNPFADAPFLVEWIDDPERVRRLLPGVEEMLTEGTITVKDVEIA